MYANPTTRKTVLVVAPAASKSPIVHLGLSLLPLQLADLLRSEVFTIEERAMATLCLYSNEEDQQLQRWVRNVTRVKQERETPPTTPAMMAVVPDTTDVLSAEEVEAEAAAMWVEQDEEQEAESLLARALHNARTNRAHRDQSADLASELAYESRCLDMLDETGHTHADLLSL